MKKEEFIRKYGSKFMHSERESKWEEIQKKLNPGKAEKVVKEIKETNDKKAS